MSSPLVSEATDPIDHVGDSRAGDRARRWPIWVVWFLALVMFSGISSGLRGASGTSLLAGLGWIVGVMAIATLGALVAWKRRSLIQGWLLAAFAFFWALALYSYHFFGFPFIGSGSDSTRELSVIRALIAVGDSSIVLGVLGFVFLLLVGPDGRLPSRRWRLVVWFLVGFAPLLIWSQFQMAARVVDVDAWLGRSTWMSYEGVALLAADEVLNLVALVVAVVFIALMAWLLTRRLRAAQGERRQQLKWMALAYSAVLVWWVLWLHQPEIEWMQTAQILLPGPALVLFALGFGMALFKYRLWDVDVVVRRSLVYGVLWLLIAGVYVAVAAGLGMLAGARFPIGVAIVLTAAATLVFQPVRRWLERVADRWVFGRRDSPVEALHILGEGVAGSGRLRDIAQTLADTASRALVLGWVRVEIDGSFPAEVGVHNEEAETTLPLAWGQEVFGSFRCQPRRGARLSGEDLALLEALVGQAALAIAHARMAARIVSAQEGERRRIERNIHDGTQQDLTNLVAQLGIAKANVSDDPTVVQDLSVIQQDAQRILGELRQLAQGIYPSVLRDGGLVSAIEDRCSRLPLDVNVRIGTRLAGLRLPPETEAGAYFFTAEALNNVLKHSDATAVDVALDVDGAYVRVVVRDDGVGFDPANHGGGSGIVGLTDRINALGGDITVNSTPGGGTLVAALLPIRTITAGQQ
ncbi:MAG TPA: histidine kinase [Acidimicrobiia bacterium]|nr:histidine kinase [Acidimicrobiia bacterium]